MHRDPYDDQEPGQAYYEDVPPSRTQPYPPPASLRLSEPAPAPRRAAPWLAVACCVVSIVSLALAAAALAFLLSYKSTAQAQIRQLAQAVANAQAGNQSNAQQLSSQAGKISTIDAGMAALAPYSKICSTDLTGPAGPATFYFLCSDVRPSGG